MEQAKKKGESISKQEYIKCYHSAEPPTSDGEAINEDTSKKEAPNKDLINKALEIALDTRKFEIELYWKRTGYFVLFIGAVFVGYYKVLQISGLSDSEKEWLLLLLAALGFLLSLLWYMANRGSKFWQENWEAHIEDLSIELGKPIFGIIKNNEHTIFNPKQFNKSYPFSVSKVNQMVSLIITFSWLIILLKEMGGDALLENYDFKTCYKTAVGFAIIFLSFFVIIWCKGFAAKELDKEDNINYFWNYSSELKLDNTSNDNDEDQN